MVRQVTPPKRVTSPTWGPPLPCRQAFNLSPQYLLPSQWVPSLAPTYSLPLWSDQYLITLHHSVEQSAAQLPSFTEIAPKSLYLCGKESVTKTDLLVVTGFVHSFLQWLLADRETECGCVTS